AHPPILRRNNGPHEGNRVPHVVVGRTDTVAPRLRLKLLMQQVQRRVLNVRQSRDGDGHRTTALRLVERPLVVGLRVIDAPSRARVTATSGEMFTVGSLRS